VGALAAAGISPNRLELEITETILLQDTEATLTLLYRLRELVPGDKVEVQRGGSVVTFTVTRTAWYPKNAFPTDAVYGPTPDRQLRLITCGGVFNHALRSYRDNLVVYAVAG